MMYYLMIIIGLLAYLLFTVSNGVAEEETMQQLKQVEEKLEQLSQRIVTSSNEKK